MADWREDLATLRAANGWYLDGADAAAERLEYLLGWQESELDRLRDLVASRAPRAETLSSREAADRLIGDPECTPAELVPLVTDFRDAARVIVLAPWTRVVEPHGSELSRPKSAGRSPCNPPES